MKALRISLSLAVGAGLVAGLAACADPTVDGSNIQQHDVGEAIETVKDDEIAAMVPQDIQDKGSFAVAVNPDVAPVKFVSTDGEISGLVPDLLHASAEVMGLEAEMQKRGFDALMPGLEAERFEVIGSINDFKDRQETIDFIDYMKSGTAILAASGFEQDQLAPEDLCGLQVGFGRGTYQQKLLEEVSADCVANGEQEVVTSGYADGGAALLSVKSGQADAFWGDAQSMLYNAQTSPDLYKIVYKDVAGPYGIGIDKDNTEFRDALHAALVKLEETGVYDQLLAKWGQEEYAMPELPLNSGPERQE